MTAETAMFIGVFAAAAVLVVFAEKMILRAHRRRRDQLDIEVFIAIDATGPNATVLHHIVPHLTAHGIVCDRWSLYPALRRLEQRGAIISRYDDKMPPELRAARDGYGRRIYSINGER